MREMPTASMSESGFTGLAGFSGFFRRASVFVLAGFARWERGRLARIVALAGGALILAFLNRGLAGVSLRLNSLYAPKPRLRASSPS